MSGADRAARAVLARLALSTLSKYRLSVLGENPRNHATIEAVGAIEALQGAGRVVARAFGVPHAEVERELGWALSLLPMQAAERLDATDPGDRFPRLRGLAEGCGGG